MKARGCRNVEQLWPWWVKSTQRQVRSFLQAYQADLLRDLDEGERMGPDAINEFHRVIICAVLVSLGHQGDGQSPGGHEGEGKKRLFWMPCIRLLACFTDAVTSVVKRFQEAKKQAVAFQKFLPHCSQVPGTAGQEQSLPSMSSS